MKRYGILIAVGLALVAGAARAQPQVEWERTFGGQIDDECYSCVKTNDGGFALAGQTESFGAGGYDGWVVRTNANGDSLWSRTFGGENADGFLAIVQTSDSGFAMAGYYAPSEFDHGDFWLVKTDANGDSLWSRTYGGHYQEACFSLIQTSDGGFALAGGTYSFGNGQGDFWLLRTNENGDSLWSQTYGDTSDEHCMSLLERPDGGFLLAGYSNITLNVINFWLVWTDETGFALWTRTFRGARNDYPSSVIPTSDDGFAVVDYTQSSGNGQGDFRLIKMNSDGDSLWSRVFGGDLEEYCYSVIETFDGGFALAGESRSLGNLNGDFWLVRTNSSGDSLWSLGYRPTGSIYSVCRSVLETGEGAFVMAGSCRMPGNESNQQFSLVKTTPDPVSVRDPSPLTPYTLLLSPAFPNPFNSTTRIGFDLGPINRGATRLEIFDPLGRRVAELIPNRVLAAGHHEAVWDAKGFPAGEYMIRLEAGANVKAAGVQVVK